MSAALKLSYANGRRRTEALTMSNSAGLCVSGFHQWFVDLGYPQLDILEYHDGEWAIIEYHNAPIIPSMTRWQLVLQGLRNVEPTIGFVEKYIKQIDPQRKAFWDRERAKTKAVYDEAERVEKHAEDSAEIAHKAITRNPDLMERIAKKGLMEMDVDKIGQHVPRSKL